MELTQLRSFLKIAEHGSFTRAAEEIGVSQPALSQQMSRLEAELGRPVFDRVGRTVQLTEAGRLLLPRAERILTMADDTRRELGDDGQSGRVVAAAIPTIAPFLLPAVLRSYRKEFPEASVQVDEEVTESLLKRCQRGELDVGVLALPGRGAAGPGDRALVRGGAGAGPARRPPSGGPGNRPARRGARGTVRPAWRRALPVGPESAASASNAPCSRSPPDAPVNWRPCRSWSHWGTGYSFVPEMARRIDASPHRVYRSLSGDRPRRTIAACWNPDRYQTRLSRAFLEALREYQPGRDDPINARGIADKS